MITPQPIRVQTKKLLAATVFSKPSCCAVQVSWYWVLLPRVGSVGKRTPDVHEENRVRDDVPCFPRACGGRCASDDTKRDFIELILILEDWGSGQCSVLRKDLGRLGDHS